MVLPSTSLTTIAATKPIIKIDQAFSDEESSRNEIAIIQSLNNEENKGAKRYLKGIFDDANLVLKISQELKNIIHEDSQGAFIYDNDTLEVKSLNLASGKISSFKGLSIFPNLKMLSIKFNGVAVNLSDLTTISDQLKYLEVNGSQINDIDFIKQFTSLDTLNLIADDISDISALAELTNLVRLNLDNNNLLEISALMALENLESLDLAFNDIHDISALSRMSKLMSLGLTSNNFSGLLPLANLLELRGLYLAVNNISDLTPLANLVNLEILSLEDNKISDLKPLENLQNLGSLFLRYNSIPNTEEAWAPIHDLPNYSPDWDNETVRSSQR